MHILLFLSGIKKDWLEAHYVTSCPVIICNLNPTVSHRLRGEHTSAKKLSTTYVEPTAYAPSTTQLF
jgi:hypothetical protein